MSVGISLSLVCIEGVFLGAIFFGGLWFTVRIGMSSEHPAVWFLASLLLRTTIALAGIYWIGNQRLDRLLVCLAGFVCARFIVTHITRPGKESARAH